MKKALMYVCPSVSYVFPSFLSKSASSVQSLGNKQFCCRGQKVYNSQTFFFAIGIISEKMIKFAG